MSQQKLRYVRTVYDTSNLQEYPNAIEVCGDIIREDEFVPHAYEAHDLLSAIFQAQGRYQDAIDAATEMVKLEPNRPHPFFKRGRLYLQSERFLEAAPDFTKVIDFSEDYFYETALFYRAIANLKIDKKQALRDTILLSDGYSFFIDFPSRGFVKMTKDDLLREAGGV
jgi:tetratricopeptide (TPR) repeat protein